jgi:integrase
VIANYRPRSMPPAAAAFTRAVVAAAGPRSAARAKALLFATGKLAVFGVSVGLPLDAGVLLHRSVIERFIVVDGAAMSGPTRRTLRTNLRFVAGRVPPGGPPAPIPLSRERAKAAYSDAELAGFLALADAQPTLGRRMRATGLICLGAGAGLMGADLRRVRGPDVVCRRGGLLVEVGGARARTVPVLSRYHEPLLAAARFAGDGYVIGGVNPQRRNVTAPLVGSLAGGIDLPRLDTGRLRATWLCRCAQQIGLPTFMAAAGISCSQRLGDLVATLEVADEADAVVLLGATR